MMVKIALIKKSKRLRLSNDIVFLPLSPFSVVPVSSKKSAGSSCVLVYFSVLVLSDECDESDELLVTVIKVFSVVSVE